MNGKALNLRNVPPELIRALHEKAEVAKMGLRDYCVMLLEKSLAPPLLVVSREVRDKLAEAINTPDLHGITPMLQYDPPVEVEVNVELTTRKPSGENIVALTPVSAEQKRFPKDVPILCTKCKKVPMRARDENTWRCPICGHQEPR